MSHTCDVCSGTKSRRAARDVFLRFPDMTTTKAAGMSGVGRSYLSIIRTEMEKTGCIQKRARDGRGQHLIERTFASAQRVRVENGVLVTGHPIAHHQMHSDEPQQPRTTVYVQRWGTPLGSVALPEKICV